MAVCVNVGGEFVVVGVGENIGVLGCGSVRGNGVDSGIFSIAAAVWELVGLLASLLRVVPWNREDELGVGDPDLGSNPGPFREGGVTGFSGLLRVVLEISENVDWTG